MQDAMGRLLMRATRIGVVCLVVSGARADELAQPAPLGWTATLGSGSSVIAGGLEGLHGNPALLAFLPRPEIAIQQGLGQGRFGPRSISLAGPKWSQERFGLAYTRQGRLESTTELRRTAWRLAYARPFGRRIAVGGVLDLANSERNMISSMSFGTDLGLHVLVEAARTRIGLVVRNALRAGTLGGTSLQPRRLETGVSRSATLASTRWTWTAAGGWEVGESSPPGVWIGGRAHWQGRFDLATGLHPDGLRFGAGYRQGSTRLEFAFTKDQRILSVHVGLGPTLRDRRASRAQEGEATLADRIEYAIEARETKKIQEWLAKADEASGRGDFETAARIFNNVLALREKNDRARTGLEQAQLGAWIQAADSLASRGEYRQASHRLQQALERSPKDSLATTRLRTIRKAIGRDKKTRTEAAEEFRSGLDAYTARRYGQAARSFEIALKLDPQHQSAAAYLEKSNQAFEVQLQTALRQARTQLARGKFAAARAALEPVRSQNLDLAEADGLLERIRIEESRWERERLLAEARRREQAENEDRSPPAVLPADLPALYEKGMQFFRTGHLWNAMETWEEVAQSAPEYRNVSHYLLRVYRVCGLESYTEGRLQKAIDIWGKGLVLEPDNQQLRRYQQQAHAKLRRIRSGRAGGR